MDIFTPTASVSLFESMLTEASTALDLLRSHPGGNALIKKAHAEFGLPHALEFDEVKSIKWADVAPSGYMHDRPINWILIKGKTGTGLIRVKERGDYFVAAFGNDDPDVETSRQTSGGNAVNWLKNHIGAFNRYLISADTGELASLKRKRMAQKQGSAVVLRSEMNEAEIVDYLVLKFKPFWVRALTGAMNDVKGWVGTQVKNHAWEKANKKLRRLAELDSELEEIHAGSKDIPDQIRKAVTYAVHLAAAHYYPENIEWSQHYGGTSSWRISNANRVQKVNQLFTDIRNGHTEKLGGVLAFFRRSLATG